MSGFVECFLNGMFVNPAEIGPELFKINGLSFDSLFVVSNVGVARGMSERVVNSPLKIAKFIIPGVMCTALGGIWHPGGDGSPSWRPVSNTCGKVFKSVMRPVLHWRGVGDNLFPPYMEGFVITGVLKPLNLTRRVDGVASAMIGILMHDEKTLP